MCKNDKDIINKGFYYIDLKKYGKKFSVSKLGTVIYSVTGDILNSYYDEDLGMYMVDTSGHDVMLPPVQYILAKCFIKESSDIAKVDNFYKRVQFIDGNTRNLNLNNLKWVLTEKGLIHKNCLGKTNKQILKSSPVLTKDIDTGEIIKYKNINDLASKANIAVTRMRRYLDSKYQGPIKLVNNCLIKREFDSWPIIPIGAKMVAFESFAPKASIKVLFTSSKDNSETVFKSINAASIALNLIKSTVTSNLKTSNGKPIKLADGSKIQYFYE